jgi:hypothetical protein
MGTIKISIVTLFKIPQIVMTLTTIVRIPHIIMTLLTTVRTPSKNTKSLSITAYNMVTLSITIISHNYTQNNNT